jgi:hypothetical protein
MQMEASGEDVPPRVEFWNQHSVPEINVLIVSFDRSRSAHDPNAFLLRFIVLNTWPRTQRRSRPNTAYCLV